MLRELGLEQAELSVLLTNDREIHELNRQHRDKDRPTDVLAFPLEEGEHSAVHHAGGPRALGDVVISLDTAARQAKGRKRELLPEVRFLLAHGLLHLLGHDHGNPTEKRAMDAETRRLVRAVVGLAPNSHKKAGPAAASPRGATPARRAKPGTRKKRPRARPAR
jgi:probable rRNA maturation factor